MTSANISVFNNTPSVQVSASRLSMQEQSVSGAFDRLVQQVGLSDNEDNDKIKEVAKDFEAMLASQLVSFMYSTVEVDENFGGGYAEETFRDFMVEEYGKVIAESGGLNISNQIQRQLLMMQQEK